MPSLRLSSTLAVRFFSGLLLATLAGCCCGPVCQEGDGSIAGGGSPAGHPRVLRRGTLSPPVPAPAVASPIPRYHPLPTHPVFETQPQYPAILPVAVDPSLLAPGMGGTPTALSGSVHGVPSRPRKAVGVPPVDSETDGEPTPALLPVEPAK